MKSAPLAALLCVLAASAAWAVDPAPRTEEEQKTDQLNLEQLGKAKGEGEAPAANRAVGLDGNPLDDKAYGALPPEARWALEQKNPDGTPKYIKAIVDANGAVLGYETSTMCVLPNGIAEDFARAQGENQPPPPAVTAPGAADESLLGATARGAAPGGNDPNGNPTSQNPTADNGRGPTDAGAEEPGQPAAPAPPTDTASPDYIAAMGDFLYTQNNPPPGAPSYDSAAAFDGPGGDSGAPRSSSGGSPNVVSDDGASPTGGQSGAIAYGNGESGGPKGSDMGAAEVKCKTKAECEAVAKSYKEAADGAALGFAANRPAEGIRSIAQTAQDFKPQAILGDVLSGSSGQAALEGGAGEDQLKEDSGRPFVGNGRVLDPAKFCSKDSKVYEALGTAGKEVKKRC